MTEHSHSLYIPLLDALTDNTMKNYPKNSVRHSNWLEGARHYQQTGQPYVIATIIAEVGSTPRDTGAKMVIGLDEQFDTLGGGNLEFQVIKKARQSINEGANGASVERFSLASDLGQCCGGAAQVLMEFMQTELPQLVVFGAGHVCQALVKIISDLPCRLTVIDSRREWLTPLQDQGIQTQLITNVEECIASLDSRSHLVIMTHDHSLDFELTERALERNCFPFIGLIGSMGKKQRFSFRLKEQLSDPQLIEQLTCPIGLPEVGGKLPMQVAVSIAAQLIPMFTKHGESLPASNVSGCGNEQRRDNEQRWDNANSLRKTLAEVTR
ncbi:xanthine dehydrogenase accessory protein XdhC [Vibrio maerlii]|uniref:xanthine dehydrogenase accessory protein XdhC n=1 Tax=Vibrio maerlii TaxID=2231648 RepID=UPI000E3D7424|nr:xanthine dehydrogenase accessory protein XdhC [Vibrio maerlii]